MDLTSDYEQHIHAVGMPASQRNEMVQAIYRDGVLYVITTMRYPYGSWACDWEPRNLAGMDIIYVRILHQDNSLFRICNL